MYNIFSGEIPGWSMYNKRRNWLTCSVSTFPLHSPLLTLLTLEVFLCLQISFWEHQAKCTKLQTCLTQYTQALLGDWDNGLGHYGSCTAWRAWKSDSVSPVSSIAKCVFCSWLYSVVFLDTKFSWTIYLCEWIVVLFLWCLCAGMKLRIWFAYYVTKY